MSRIRQLCSRSPKNVAYEHQCRCCGHENKETVNTCACNSLPCVSANPVGRSQNVKKVLFGKVRAERFDIGLEKIENLTDSTSAPSAPRRTATWTQCDPDTKQVTARRELEEISSDFHCEQHEHAEKEQPDQPEAKHAE